VDPMPELQLPLMTKALMSDMQSAICYNNITHT
jgi:hypothetical protein